MGVHSLDTSAGFQTCYIPQQDERVVYVESEDEGFEDEEVEGRILRVEKQSAAEARRLAEDTADTVVVTSS